MQNRINVISSEILVESFRVFQSILTNDSIMAKLELQGKQGTVRFDNQLLDGYEKVFDEISDYASRGQFQNLILDLTSTRKITSSGVAKLLTLKNLMDHFGVKLEVMNLHPPLLDVLKKFKVDVMLKIRS